MTSFALKWVAIVTMLIDHIGLLFFPQDTPQYVIFRIIGRLAFPIFCFLLAQGFIHTGSKKRYLLRLLVFALISEYPYYVFINNTWKWEWGIGFNVMFELLAGFIGMLLLEQVQKAGEKSARTVTLKIVYIAAFLGVCIISELLHFSYGAYGILMIGGFYLFRKNRYLQNLALILCTVTHSIYIGRPSAQIYAVFTCIILSAYNGKKGRDFPKYVFYLFYPAHLLLLFGIKSLIS